MEKYATLNEERRKPSFKWTKGFDATPNEELPLQSEDKIAADLLDTWLSFMRPGVFPTYEVLDFPVPGRQTYRMSCKVNQHVTEVRIIYTSHLNNLRMQLIFYRYW